MVDIMQYGSFTRNNSNVAWLIRAQKDGLVFVGGAWLTQEGWIITEVYNDPMGIVGRLYLVENGSLKAIYQLSGQSMDVWRERAMNWPARDTSK